MTISHLYLLTVLLACVMTAASLPLWRNVLGRSLLDTPGGLKRHHTAVPCVGGFAVFTGLAISLIFIRMTTHFPTGTLHSLRGVLCASAMIFALGILDDLNKPKGVNLYVKLFVQILATCCIIAYRVHINLFNCPWLDFALTFLWVIGITNAFNLLDISDGLCVSQACIIACGLCLISLPSKQVYVNFGACALAGACLGFWPYNHARACKSFLGDSGSTLLGFTLATLAMGAQYSQHSAIGFLAPLLIFAVPIFDTAFVSIARMLQGKNPLRGSPDHIAIRLKKHNYSGTKILCLFILACLISNLLVWTITYASGTQIVILFVILFAMAVFLSWKLWLMKPENTSWPH